MSEDIFTNKENVTSNKQIEDKIYDAELGVFPLSEDEECLDEVQILNKLQLPQLCNNAITPEFLDQAEKCLNDIEYYTKNETVKMKLINQLYQHIQNQKNVAEIPSNETEIDARYNSNIEEKDTCPEIDESEPTVDEMVIRPARTFEELLEENLAKETEKTGKVVPKVPVQGSEKPKRKFLKRGEGIARFNSAPVRKPKKPVKKKAAAVSKPLPSKTIDKKFHSGQQQNKMAHDSRESHKGEEEVVMNPIRSPPTSPQYSISKKLSLSFAADLSALGHPATAAARMAAEERELEEFRLLEEAAADKSINTLINMLRLSHTADKKDMSPIQEESRDHESRDIDSDDEGGNVEVVFPMDRKRKLELEQQPKNTDEVMFNDGESWDFEEGSEGAGVLGTPVPLPPPEKHQEEDKPSKLLGHLFPGLRPPPPPAPEVKPPPKHDPDYERLKEELKVKLAELEKEVEKFQREAAGLARARCEKESELRKMRAENEEYVKEQEEKERKFQEYKDSEMKKIRAEKKQLEMSALSAQQRAAKLELVDTLTQRTKELEEELTRKEQRWNATFTRLKNRAEDMERENEQVRAQIRILEQQKLEAWEREVERSSQQRHRHTQTLGLPKQESAVTKTKGTPTAASSTVYEFKDSNLENAELDKENNKNKNNNVAQQLQTKGLPETRVAAAAPTTERESKKEQETVGPDGSVTITYPNGTVKYIAADGGVVRMTYFNGDTKETYRDGRNIYKFKKDNIIQIQSPNGTEKLIFPSGQQETKYSDGKIEIVYPDKSTKITYSNGEEKCLYSDGTVVTTDISGQKLILLPNGQKEIHTTAFKRREYPDGTSKTVFNDGRQETIHANGRVRKKDPSGKLIADVLLDVHGNVITNYLVK